MVTRVMDSLRATVVRKLFMCANHYNYLSVQNELLKMSLKIVAERSIRLFQSIDSANTSRRYSFIYCTAVKKALQIFTLTSLQQKTETLAWQNDRPNSRQIQVISMWVFTIQVLQIHLPCHPNRGFSTCFDILNHPYIQKCAVLRNCVAVCL